MTKFFLDGPRISFEQIKGVITNADVTAGYITSATNSISAGDSWSSSLGVNPGTSWSFFLNDVNNGITVENNINLTELYISTFGTANAGAAADDYGEEDIGFTVIFIEWDKNRVRGLSYQYQTSYAVGIGSHYWNSNSITQNGVTTISPVILNASMVALTSSFQIDTQNNIRSITRLPAPYNVNSPPQMPQFTIKNYKIRQL